MHNLYDTTYHRGSLLCCIFYGVIELSIALKQYNLVSLVQFIGVFGDVWVSFTRTFCRLVEEGMGSPHQ